MVVFGSGPHPASATTRVRACKRRRRRNTGDRRSAPASESQCSEAPAAPHRVSLFCPFDILPPALRPLVRKAHDFGRVPLRRAADARRAAGRLVEERRGSAPRACGLALSAGPEREGDRPAVAAAYRPDHEPMIRPLSSSMLAANATWVIGRAVGCSVTSSPFETWKLRTSTAS